MPPSSTKVVSGRKATQAHRRPKHDFDHDARHVLEALRDALARLLQEIPGGPPTRAVDLGEALHLGTELRWQVFTVANASDVFEAGVNVPKAGSINSLLRAAAQAKVPTETIDLVRDAHAAYERVVAAHASDRTAFDSMLRAFSAQRGDQIDVRVRKNLFLQQSILWGLRQKVSYRCTILHQGARENLLDGINLMGSVELHPLRNGVPLALVVSSVLHNEIPSEDGTSLRIDEAPGTVEPLMILREFCSGPIPAAAGESPDAEGRASTTLKFDGIGRGSAFNLALAQVCRGAQASILKELGGDVVMNSPTELLCDDMLVPAGWSIPESIRVYTYANRINDADVWKKRPEDRLPMRVVATHQGRVRTSATDGKLVRPMPEFIEVPHYSKIVTRVLNDVGWADTEFDLYRCRVEYPILKSMTAMVVDGVPARKSDVRTTDAHRC